MAQAGKDASPGGGVYRYERSISTCTSTCSCSTGCTSMAERARCFAGSRRPPAPNSPGEEPFTTRVGNVSGFSLHAGVAVRANERDKLERLCRYITRPAVSEKCLSFTEHGQVRYTLKTPWRDGATHVIFEPQDFIARLAALIPKPRVNLTRFHGIFAPNSKHRALITPAGRGRGGKTTDEASDRTPAERHIAMTWAQRLKRVFNIDITTCQACGGAMKVIAAIEDPAVIRKILDHLGHNAPAIVPTSLPQPRAPPQAEIFDSI